MCLLFCLFSCCSMKLYKSNRQYRLIRFCHRLFFLFLLLISFCSLLNHSISFGPQALSTHTINRKFCHVHIFIYYHLTSLCVSFSLSFMQYFKFEYLFRMWSFFLLITVLSILLYILQPQIYYQLCSFFPTLSSLITFTAPRHELLPEWPNFFSQCNFQILSNI